MPADAAREVAATMVAADLLGYRTHGAFRLRQYVSRLRDGGGNPTASPRIVPETVATALIDGDDGLGHLAMNRAAGLAIARARGAGVGWVGVRGSNHAGPAALYVRRMAEAGMIGLAGAVGSVNHMPPWGGMDILLGTNPIAISAPSGSGDPFVLDMATSVAAMGKIKTRAQQGGSTPEGWMIGRDGRPLTDPKRRAEGLLMPIGGPRGYGLSVAIGLLPGVLNGAAFGSTVVDLTKDTTSPTNTGQFVAAIDISAFVGKEAFLAEADRVFTELRGATRLPGHGPIRSPGEGRNARRAANLAKGWRFMTRCGPTSTRRPATWALLASARRDESKPLFIQYFDGAFLLVAAVGWCRYLPTRPPDRTGHDNCDDRQDG